MTTLLKAAQAVLDRWNSVQWKDLEPTGHYMNALRDAIEAETKKSEDNYLQSKLDALEKRGIV